MAEYKIHWYSKDMSLLVILVDFNSLEYAWSENSIGILKISLPADEYPSLWVKRDSFFALYRNGILEMECIWFLRRIEFDDTNNILTLLAYSPNYLLGDPDNRAGRIVIYESGSVVYTELQDYADDMLKTLVLQNMGLGALDAVRDLSNYLSISKNTSSGPIISKSCAKALLLPLFQEICESARQEGTPVYFDIVCTSVPYAMYTLQLEFRTYTSQRGRDLRNYTISKDMGNISNSYLIIDYGPEITVCYAAGAGEGSLQPQESYTAPRRSVASAFNRRESFISISSTDDTAVLISAAKQYVSNGKPKVKFTGSIVDTENFRYGVEWGFGDRVSVYTHGFTFDARISAISVKVSQGAESVEANISGEEDL